MSDLDLLNALKKAGYKKSKLKEIATLYSLTESKLKNFYTTQFFKDISREIDLKTLSEKNIDHIETILEGRLSKEFGFIKSDMKKILEKALYIAMTNGFTTNINNLESGVMTANAGDSAEFVFVARAILAGFNCSSVDVRSSRYDAIIDYNDKLLRVQIKGISTGNTISFKDRDRGGQGIDHHHERNIGKRITSKDCDIYVAVDKQVGLCYIIPMSFADTLDEDACKNVSLVEMIKFRENWDVIKGATREK